MRNKLFILILMFAVAVCFGTPVFADVTVMAGADLMGSWEVSGDMEADGDTDMGFFLGGEFSTSISPLVSVGGGLRYQLERNDSDVSEMGWNFIPIYALVHLNFPAAFADFFAAGQVGYNIFQINSDTQDAWGDPDVSGGLYYGIGGGLKLPMGLQFELLYSVNNGTLEQGSASADFTASQVSLSVGFNF
jgi:hypothetical protein